MIKEYDRQLKRATLESDIEQLSEKRRIAQDKLNEQTFSFEQIAIVCWFKFVCRGLLEFSWRAELDDIYSLFFLS